MRRGHWLEYLPFAPQIETARLTLLTHLHLNVTQ
jgi:hypothetical protein